MRHFLVVFEDIPHVHHGGAGVLAHSAIMALRAAGHRVSVAALAVGGLADVGPEALIAALETHGVAVHVLPPPPRPRQGVAAKILRNTAFPALRNLFPGADQGPALRALLADIRPDAVFAYHWNAIAASVAAGARNLLGIVSDPAHQPLLFRQQFGRRYRNYGDAPSLPQRLIHARRAGYYVAAMRQLLNGCAVSGGFAAHEVAYYRAIGATDCRHFRTPIADPLAELPAASAKRRAETPFKILHIGHLRGIATLSGVELLADEILPILRERLPQGSFEIHLVGRFAETMPQELRDKLSLDCVKFRGHIVPPDEEFLSAHLVLVPTPIDLGLRVRIVTAMAYGRAVVAHRANQSGLPELRDGIDCLLGDDGESLARHCLALRDDPARRAAIETAARQAYEAQFSWRAAGAAIAETLCELADRPPSALPEISQTGAARRQEARYAS